MVFNWAYRIIRFFSSVPWQTTGIGRLACGPFFYGMTLVAVACDCELCCVCEKSYSARRRNIRFCLRNAVLGLWSFTGLHLQRNLWKHTHAESLIALDLCRRFEAMHIKNKYSPKGIALDLPLLFFSQSKYIALRNNQENVSLFMKVLRR